MKNSTRFCLQLSFIAACVLVLPTIEIFGCGISGCGISGSGIFGSGLSSVAVAQDGTMSHRRLELPRNSPSQPQEQLARLLQYIQSLKGEASTPQDSSEANDPTLSQLKQAMGPELSSMLDSLPPNVVSDAMKDPAIRSEVKNMLQQFSKDGTVPEFINRPRQNRATENNAPKQPRPKTGQPNAPKNNDGSIKPRTGQNSPQFGPPQTTPTSPQLPDGSQLNAQDRLRDLIEQLRERNSLPENSGRLNNEQLGNQSGNQTDSQQIPEIRPTGEQSSSNSSMTEAQWEERLRQLMQKQRDSVRKPQGRPNTDRSPSNSNRDSQTQNSFNNIPSGSDRDLNNRADSGSPRATNPSQPPRDQDGSRIAEPNTPSQSPTGIQPAPSLSEFLEQMRDAPTPDLKDLGVDLSAASQGKNKGSQGNLLADAMKQMNPQELREQAQKALQDKGFRNTLKDILKDAKQSAKQEASSGGGPSDMIADIAAATGMEDTVLEALGGMTEELVEIAKDAKFQSGRHDSSSDPQASANSPANASSTTAAANTADSSKPAQEKSAFSQFTESASNAINNFSQTPSAPAADSATTDILPDLGGGNFSMFLFLLLLIIGLIACLFVGSRLMPVSEPETSEQVLASLLKQGIRSREDVIKAFHQFALKPPHETQQWWTHSKVVETVVHQYPQHSARIQLLASLYEQARYFPAETEFTDAQIQQAAEAVRTVGVA